MQCLHCEISELMMRRQAQGEKITPEVIFKICEVIGDIAASATSDDATEIFRLAREALDRFDSEIARGAYTSSGVHGPATGFRSH